MLDALTVLMMMMTTMVVRYRVLVFKTYTL